MSEPTFAICISNFGYEASLELRKLYEILPDADAGSMNQMRIIDESGEDYLYPDKFFVIVHLPEAIEKKILHAA